MSSIPELVRLAEEAIERLMTAVSGDPDEALRQVEYIRQRLHQWSPQRDQPVDHVRWIPVNLVEPNDYNPNSVASIEMGLLHTSVSHDGFTQPVVAIWHPARGRYVIVDGFHRYFLVKNSDDICKRTRGLVPVVVIDKDINDRMASTVRHNRARGKHSVQGMANMVFAMLDRGWSDAEVCNELGMEAEELLRLKHITGFSKLFADQAYNRAWVTRNQIMIKRMAERREVDAKAVDNGEPGSQ